MKSLIVIGLIIKLMNLKAHQKPQYIDAAVFKIHDIAQTFPSVLIFSVILRSLVILIAICCLKLCVRKVL